MENRIKELKADLEELERVASHAQRTKVKDILTIQIAKLRTEIVNLEEGQKAATPSESKPVSKVVPVKRRALKEIKQYGWDQSDKFMKFYIDVQGVHEIPEGQVTCEYTEKSFNLKVEDCKNADHRCHVVKLFEKVIPEGSKYKVKKDMVLVMLKKKEEKTWPYDTEREDKKSKAPEPDVSGDPNAGLMNMLKKMYDEGDDEMKKTIGKAWTESQSKKSTGDMPTL